MNLFDSTTTNDILTRIEQVKPDTPAVWGKMNAAQMLAHCQGTFHSFFGEGKTKQSLTGILFGKIAKKKMFDNKPWPHGLPTDKTYVVTNERDFSAEKEKLVAYIKRFSEEGYTITACVHPFFGKMSSQEWAILGYKHLDHHLRQFGI